VGRELSSTLDLATVMDRIARHAKDLLNAENSAIFLPDTGGTTYRAIVAIGEVADAIRETVVEPGVGIIGNLVASGEAAYVNDTEADPRGVQIRGTEQRREERLIVAPLIAAGAVKGAMALWRTAGKPFDDAELAYLVSLSRQASVAIENARLFKETRESLERQTATAEVLQVISSSMDDPKPVFDKILESCKRLFTGAEPVVCLIEGDDALVVGAYRGQFASEVANAFPRPLAGTVSGMTIAQGSVLYRPSVLAAHDLPSYIRELAQKERRFFPCQRTDDLGRQGHRHHRHHLHAAAAVLRCRASLLTTFADQAVIAIQNARLFNETKEALEQQTASAEVLRVISGSMADATPVFDKIFECCERLFPANGFALATIDEQARVDVPLFRLTAAARASLGASEADALESDMRAGFRAPWPAR